MNSVSTLKFSRKCHEMKNSISRNPPSQFLQHISKGHSNLRVVCRNHSKFVQQKFISDLARDKFTKNSTSRLHDGNIRLFRNFSFVQKFSSTTKKSFRYKALSIDGGGIRGIIPGIVLKHIEENTKIPISSSFDFIAGTSTGGILGLGLSLRDPLNREKPNFKASEVLDFYLKEAFRKRIFQKPTEKVSTKKLTSLEKTERMQQVRLNREFRKGPELISIEFGDGHLKANAIGNGFTVSTDSLNNINAYQIDSNIEGARVLFQPKYTNEGIESVLKNAFGPARLTDLIPQEVFVTSFNTSKMIHQIWSKQLAQNKLIPNIPSWKAARATSAAPTFFPAYVIKKEEYVDGGVCMNNPILMLCARLKQMKIPLDEVLFISLGTGEFVQPLAPTAHFGQLQWAPNIFDSVCYGISSQTDEYARTILQNDQYYRIQAKLRRNIPLDSSSDVAINELISEGRKIIQENKPALDTIFKLLAN